MNKLVNKLLLAGDTFVPEMHLKQQEIQIIFTRMNWIKLVLNMIWLMEILKT